MTEPQSDALPEMAFGRGTTVACKGEHPTAEAQARYPLAEYPCAQCVSIGLPQLVDNSSEFYWHHVHPESRARSGCARFGTTEFCGSIPRRGTAAVTEYVGYRRRQLERRSAE